jgi:hypothetical protein
MSSPLRGIGPRQGDAISWKNRVAVNHLVTLGLVFLLAALVVALDGSLALKAIDQLAQSEAYTDIQNVMSRTPLSGSEAVTPALLGFRTWLVSRADFAPVRTCN